MHFENGPRGCPSCIFDFFFFSWALFCIRTRKIWHFVLPHHFAADESLLSLAQFCLEASYFWCDEKEYAPRLESRERCRMECVGSVKKKLNGRAKIRKRDTCAFRPLVVIYTSKGIVGMSHARLCIALRTRPESLFNGIFGSERVSRSWLSVYPGGKLVIGKSKKGKEKQRLRVDSELYFS